MNIRPAEEKDAEALAAIYGHHVLHGFGTFEEVPPGAAEIDQRRQAIVARGLPYLLAEEDDKVLGFAYAAPFRLRAAYRYTAEDSVYIAPEAHRKGVGRAVLSAVLDACAELGLRQIVAVIGDSENAGSIGLHSALGFEPIGVAKGFGYKKGRWVDLVLMQKALNGGTEREPDAAGLTLSGV
jgi:L-amino acid N-acyltransferase YncA